MRHSRLIAITALPICLFFAVIGVSRRALQTWPVSDGALIELYTVYATRGLQAVGAYSRFGWHHPGPALFYLLAPFYLLGGSTDVALAGGAVWINLISVLAVVWALGRTSTPPPLGVAMLVLIGLYVVRAHAVLASAWNPHILVFPFVAFVVGSATLSAGEFRLLPILGLLASFLVQLHVSVIPVVFGVVLASLLLLVGLPGRPAWQQVRIWVTLTLAVLALLWALPVGEELVRTPGNLTLLWRYFVNGRGASQTAPTSIRAWADVLLGILRTDFQIPHGWLFQPAGGTWPIVAAIGETATLGLTALFAWKRRQRALLSFAVIALVASIIACWTITRIRGDIVDHDIFWISALGAVNLGVILGTVGMWIDRQPTRHYKGLALGVAIGFVLLCTGAAFRELVAIDQRSHINGGEERAARELTQQIQRGLSQLRIRKPYVRVDLETWTIASGVLLQLYKAGIPFTVEQPVLFLFESPLASTGDEDAELTISGPMLHRALAAVPDYAAIATYNDVFVDYVRFRENDPRRRKDR